jgi:oligopeptidase A
MTNPLLENNVLPAFSKIKPEYVEPALNQVLEQAKQTVEDLLKNQQQPTWQSLVMPMEALDATIDKVWSPVSHLNSR